MVEFVEGEGRRDIACSQGDARHAPCNILARRAHEFSSAMLGAIARLCGLPTSPSSGAHDAGSDPRCPRRFPAGTGRALRRDSPPATPASGPRAWDGIPERTLRPARSSSGTCATSRATATTCASAARWTKTRPLLADIDSYALAAVERGDARHAREQALDEFEAARAETVALLASLTPAQLARPAHLRRLRPGHRARPDALAVQPRPAASRRPAMARMPDRRRREPHPLSATPSSPNAPA